jgi:hypothetical protein
MLKFSSGVLALEAYGNFSEALTNLADKAESLSEFSAFVKADPEIRRLKQRARSEFEQIYSLLARHFDVPYLPVNVPLRKKVSVRGKAYASPSGFPTEIRIYPIEAPNKPYQEWRPSDLSCSSRTDILDTFIHEVAHVLEAKRYGRMGHGQNFKKVRCEIEEILREYGFGGLITPK